MNDKYLNQIIEGDCLKILPQIDDNSVDMAVLDPPYPQEFIRTGWEKDKFLHKIKRGTDPCGIHGIYWSWFGSLINELRRILIEDYHCYVFIDWVHVRQAMDILEEKRFFIRNLLVWDKCSIGLGRGYRSQHELILFCKGKGKPVNSDSYGNVLQIKSRSKGVMYEKPEALIEIFINQSTNEGDVILDSCLGSGTTAVVAKKLNRNFIGIEINPDHVKIAKERLNKCPVSLTQFKEKEFAHGRLG